MMHSLPRSWSILGSLLLWVGVALSAGADDAARKQQAQRFEKQVPALLGRYCVACHGVDEPEAELTLAGAWKFDEIESQRARWERVLKMIESGVMPPDGEPQPTGDERRELAQLIESALYYLDCDLPRDPGRVTIRRLNRAEYNNTIRDLLGVDTRPAADFPSDDVGNGFDNIGDVLSLSPLLFEKYIDAAEQIAQAAITLPNQTATQRKQGRELTSSGAARLNRDGVHGMFSQGTVAARFHFRRGGRYTVSVVAGADQAGPEWARLELQGPGNRRQVVEVTADAPELETYSWTTVFGEGEHEISASFINDYYQPDAADPKQRDRNLYVRALEVTGPLDQRPDDLPASHRRLLTAAPKNLQDRGQVRDAARAVLAPFISRAFRRKAADEEVDAYVRLVEQVVAKGESFERGVQVALTGVLVSPKFLFRLEQDPDPDDPKKSHPISDYELATRLSYFLWSSMPDDELFAVATRNELSQPDVLQQQVRRMLADPKAYALAENFASQWLNLRNLNEVSPDPEKYPEFNDALRRDMQRETLEFFAWVMRQDRPVTDFIDAPYSLVNGRLAEFYGWSSEGLGDQFQKVDLPPERRGVLTHAGVLTLTSNPARTSPVKRGKWIMENILGTPPPDPPANVPPLEDTQKSSPDLPLRKQLELHRADAVCASCHRQMDALGFAFERFDALGRRRDQDRGVAIDASGVLPGGETFNDSAELIRILARRQDDFDRLLAEKMLTYALGRGLEFYDRCAVDDIVKRLQADEQRFSALVLGIVLSEPFRLRRGEAVKSAAD